MSYDKLYGSLAGQPGYPSEARYATRLLTLLRRKRLVTWSPDASYLDIGCGLGFKTRALADSFATACGVDLSATAIELATRLNDLDRLQFKQLDAERDDLGGRFDVVTAFGASMLNTWDEERFADLFRSLADRFVADGGTLVVVDQSDFSGAEREGWVNHTRSQFHRMRALIGHSLSPQFVLPGRMHDTYTSFGAEHALRAAARAALHQRRDCCFVANVQGSSQ